MPPFRRLEAVACPLPLANLDTDQIIPARFMTRSRSDGYGRFLFHDLRSDADGKPGETLALDRPERAGAAILVARRNFGSGSSREAAVYALADFGIRCVIAPSFGDIFAANAANNGLLAARISERDCETLLGLLDEGRRTLAVDLEAKRIEAGNRQIGFDIDPIRRMKLLNGWDDLDLTARYADAIGAFAEEDARRRPWMVPGDGAA